MIVRLSREVAAQSLAAALAVILALPLGSLAAAYEGAPAPAAAPSAPVAPLEAPLDLAAPLAPAAAVTAHPVIDLINQLQAKGVVLPETLATPADAQKLAAAAAALPEGSPVRQMLVSLAKAVPSGSGSSPALTNLAELGRLYENASSKSNSGGVFAALSKLGFLPSGLRRSLAARAAKKVAYPEPENPETFAVPLARLRWAPAAEKLPETSRDIQAAERKIVGQDRALNSIYFGLKMPGGNYNLYVSGAEGTGRETALLDIAKKVAAAMPTPADRVSVTNVADKDHALVLSLPAGQGPKLEAALAKFVKGYQTGLIKTLNSPQAVALRKKVKGEAESRIDALDEQFHSEVSNIRLPGNKFGVAFFVEKTQDGAVEHSVQLTYPKDGRFEPLTEEEGRGLIESGAFTEQEWEQARKDSAAEGKKLSDHYGELSMAKHAIQSEANEQLGLINLKIANAFVRQLAAILLQPVMKNRHDTTEHKAYEQRAQQRLEAFALEAARPTLAGKYGFAFSASDGGLEMQLVQAVDGQIQPVEDLQSKIEAGEFTPEQLQAAAAPLVRKFKALLKQNQQEHEAVHAGDEPLSADEKQAAEWVNAVLAHAGAHYLNFLPGQDESGAMAAKPADMYKVSVLSTNEPGKGAPVVFDRNPSLLGTFGLGSTGQTMMVPGAGPVRTQSPAGPKIKPGTLMKANGGIWIAYATDVLSAPGVYQNLMRFARDGQVEVFQMVDGGIAKLAGKSGDAYQVPAKVKIVLIGSPTIRMMLSEHDQDFNGAFNATAEFESRLPISEETTTGYLQFIRNAISGSEGQLAEMSRDAISALLEYAARAIRSNEKLTAQFGLLHGLMREATFWAREAGRSEVRREDVDKALEVRDDSDMMFARHYQDAIFKGVEIFETSGSRVGQINGLAVLGNKFGTPLRVTIVTSGSDGGFQMTSPDNEAGWTGSYFKKSFADVRGFVENLFGREKALKLKVQVSFEQTPGIDGDSATSTMMYGILSSLSGVPIKQGIAVTGSADQFGNIQAIGGINEKIEGFYDLCKHRGLTGDQGIVMPSSNVGDLMLKPEIVQAVREGKFHIYAVSNIKEGIEILTGVSFAQIYAKAKAGLIRTPSPSPGR